MTAFIVDGVSLDHALGAWFLDHSTLLPAAPARRVSRLDLPHRSGVVTSDTGWGTGSLKVAVNVMSWADVPVVQSLLARARRVSREGRFAQVVEVQVSDPERVARDAWRLSADFELQPFWREAATLTSPATSPGAVTFAQWAGSTGDVQDGILRVKGPLTRCSITGRGGVSFERSLTAAQYVYIDVAAFRAWYSTSATAWTPTATAVLLDYPASGPLVLEPSAAGIALSMSGDGFVTSGTEAQRTGVTLRGGRYWL